MQPASHRDSHTHPHSAQTQHTTCFLRVTPNRVELYPTVWPQFAQKRFTMEVLKGDEEGVIMSVILYWTVTAVRWCRAAPRLRVCGCDISPVVLQLARMRPESARNMQNCVQECTIIDFLVCATLSAVGAAGTTPRAASELAIASHARHRRQPCLQAVSRSYAPKRHDTLYDKIS